MTNLILNGTEVLTLTLDPNWTVPSNVTINNHVYETREKEVIGDIVTYSLNDSGLS